ncbi:hypothetical protein thsps21_23650 [Pseudomonas sp. No.21]|nr:hypothetical protein TUM20249_28690 [Pseudomonas tohonis]
MRHAELAQVFAHGHAGLSRANDERIDFYGFNGHVSVLLQGDSRLSGGAAGRDGDEARGGRGADRLHVLADRLRGPGFVGRVQRMVR